jgi:hypothetical protein
MTTDKITRTITNATTIIITNIDPSQQIFLSAPKHSFLSNRHLPVRGPVRRGATPASKVSTNSTKNHPRAPKLNPTKSDVPVNPKMSARLLSHPHPVY